MDRVELLTVTDTFQIANWGLVVTPDFSVPNRWKNLSETVSVVTPDGHEFEALAQFNMTHLNIRGSGDVDKRWRIVVCLPEERKDDVPIGSKIFVAREVRDAVLRDDAA